MNIPRLLFICHRPVIRTVASFMSIVENENRLADRVPFMRPNASKAEYNNFWEDVWSVGVPFGELWDLGGPHKALVHLLEQEKCKVKGKTVLVPGCGRGYDAIALAEKGGIVTGLEISKSAAKTAQDYLQHYSHILQNSITVEYLNADFFQHKGSYEIGYDYTFFCAIHPNLRQHWAEKWAELLTSGNRLITIVFPIVPQKLDGPPWHVDTTMVTQLLKDDFELELEMNIDADLSAKYRKGKEAIMIWKRK